MSKMYKVIDCVFLISFFAFGTSTDTNCGGIVTEPGYIEAPKENDELLTNTTCTWRVIAKKDHGIVLAPQQINLVKSTDCELEYLAFYDGNFTEDPLIGKWCGSVFISDLYTTNDTMLVVFKAGSDKNRAGFKLVYIERLLRPVREAPADIFSPNFPKTYPPYYKEVLKVFTSNHTNLIISFIHFDLQWSPDCECDYVKFYEGPLEDGSLIGTYCGTNKTEPFLSRTSEIHIVVKFDEEVARTGYRILIAPHDIDCYKTYTLNHGWINSPNFPYFAYLNNMHCEYGIHVEAQYRVKLSFIDFSLEESENCKNDMLLVYDGASTSDPLLGTFCGTDYPDSLTASGNQMLLKFDSDMTVMGVGFNIEYTAVN